MLHLALIVVAQLVEAQTVQRRVDERRQLRLENGILRGIQQTLEHGVLHPLAVVHTALGDFAQTFAPGRSFGIDAYSGFDLSYWQSLLYR